VSGKENSKLIITQYWPKIPNPNTQIPNNIQIRKSNDQNIRVTYLLFEGRLHVLKFAFWSLVFVWDLVFGA
jgi:hypothetical protein